MGLLSAVLTYDTTKTVNIKSMRVGLIFRGLQFCILAYIIGYSIVYRKGYQETDSMVSSIILKVKGIGSTCEVPTAPGVACSPYQVRIWDPADYVIPAQENNALFIQTNQISTRQYQRSQGWYEDPEAETTGTVHTFPCKTDDDCPPNAYSRNGLLTGHCDDRPAPNNTHRCMVYGWGPVELKSADTASQQPGFHNHMPSAQNFTIFVKNSIFFPKFQRRFSNVGVGNSSSTYLSSCIFHPKTDPYCPIFRVGDLVQLAGVESFDEVMMDGAVITVNLDYQCNLDSRSPDCPATMSFERVDSNETKLSKGYNFRWAKYFFADAPADNGTTVLTEQRLVYKSYGLRFIFYTSGAAGKFSVVPTILALGSGMGLLGVATLVADLVVTKLLKRRVFYSSLKYEVVEVPEDSLSFDQHTPLIQKP